jgi:hypothetical protein
MGAGYLSKGIALMRSDGVNLVCCDVQLFGAESGEWVPAGYDPYGIRYNNCIPTLVMYDKALWQLVGGYRRAFPFNEDWDFFIRCSNAGMVVGRIREKLFRYRVTESGLAHCFIKDTWEFSVSLMATANEALYPVEEVLRGQETLMGMPHRWQERFRTQLEVHPEEWLLHFWLGLVAEKSGAVDDACRSYDRARRLVDNRDWQPLYRLALLTSVSENAVVGALLHVARTLRPELTRLISGRLDQALRVGT